MATPLARTPSLPFVLPRTCSKAPAGQKTVSVRGDRGRPVASCWEWHGNGTAGEYDVGSRLAVVASTRAIGEAVQGNASLVGKRRQGARQPVTVPCDLLRFSDVGSGPPRHTHARSLPLNRRQLSTSAMISALKAVVSKRSKLNTTDCGPALSLRSQRRVYGPPA